MIRKKRVIGKIVSNEQAGKGIFRCVIEAPYIAHNVVPGNFINLSLNSKNVACLLKRPISISEVEGDKIVLLIKIKGKMTAVFSKLNSNTEVEIWGPLGNKFSIPKNKNILLFGGGIGIAPLKYLESRLLEQGNKVKVFYAVTKRQELALIGFKDQVLHVDEEEGFFACKKLVKIIKENNIEEIKACGPLAMLKETAMVAHDLKIPLEVSLEARMACGFGVCVGCVVQTKAGFKRVCVDGPVFDSKEIWE